MTNTNMNIDVNVMCHAHMNIDVNVMCHALVSVVRHRVVSLM
jgi:hypothetical protein